VHALLALPAIEADLGRIGLHARLHAGDIAARAEALARAGDDERTNAAIATQLLQQLDQFGAHGVAHRIAFFWPVQGQDGNAVFLIEVDESVLAHYWLSCI